MARQTIRAAMPPIDEPIGIDATGAPIFLPEPWRRLFEYLYTAVFFQGTDPTKSLSEGGIILGTGTDGDYVENITSGTGVLVTGGSGEGSNPVIAIGQPVGTSDTVQFDAINVGHASDTTIRRASAGNIQVEGNLIWSASNDGAASGLDADLLDGQQGSFYLDRANHTGSQAWGTITGTPTTLAGYGITDAASDSELSSGLATKVTKTAAITDASTAHALNAVYSDTEVESALNDLGSKINEIIDALNA